MTPSRSVPPPPSVANWPVVLDDARAAADSGDYETADRLLGEFEQSAGAGAADVSESTYWRALFALDPANPQRSTQEVLRLVDAYLALFGPQPHRTEMQTFRRIALERDSLTREVETTRTARDSVIAAEAPRERARDEELERLRQDIQRLRDDSTKNAAELERIRRRLATPRP